MMEKLNWNINPLEVWFLTALWHDVGYGIQKYSEISRMIFDTAESVEYADNIKYQHLNFPEFQIAIRDISSVIPRLLEPAGYRTTWVRQNQNMRKSKRQNEIIKTIEHNFINSHGASSAIQLHRDLIQKVNLMTNDNKREVLFQTILLACCSIPFHDWHFRKSLRECIGRYYIRNEVLPFAATLAFIDSLQVDRREISEIRKEIEYLETLIIRTSRCVEAKVN